MLEIKAYAPGIYARSEELVQAARDNIKDPPGIFVKVGLESLRGTLRFINDDTMAAMFVIPADLGPVPVEINRLDNQSLVRYYEAEWRRYE